MKPINLEQEKKEILNRYRALLRACSEKTSAKEKKDIRKAFNLAVDAHKDMRRKSGEPYIYHPIAVAHIAANEIGLGKISILPSICHKLNIKRPIIITDKGLLKLGYVEKINKILEREHIKGLVFKDVLADPPEYSIFDAVKLFKKFNADGEMVGEYRFLGLYTSSAYLVRVGELPLIRKKIAKVFMNIIL